MLIAGVRLLLYIFCELFACVARPDAPGICRAPSGLKRLESRPADYARKIYIAKAEDGNRRTRI